MNLKIGTILLGDRKRQEEWMEKVVERFCENIDLARKRYRRREGRNDVLRGADLNKLWRRILDTGRFCVQYESWRKKIINKFRDDLDRKVSMELKQAFIKFRIFLLARGKNFGKRIQERENAGVWKEVWKLEKFW